MLCMSQPVWTSRTSTQMAIGQANRYAVCHCPCPSSLLFLLHMHAYCQNLCFPHYDQDAHGVASLLVSTSFPNLKLVMLQDRTLLQDTPNMLVLVLLYMMQGVPLGLTMGAMYAFRIAPF